MTITWLGHSCFLLESGGFRVLIDPFQGVPGLPDTAARANAVYCSHGHFDHNHTQNVTLAEGGEDPFAVTEVPSSHDGQGGTLRGPNTIRRFAAEGLSVVHLGTWAASSQRSRSGPSGPATPCWSRWAASTPSTPRGPRRWRRPSPHG